MATGVDSIQSGVIGAGIGAASGFSGAYFLPAKLVWGTELLCWLFR